ncbi:metallophosphoesterase family protein [Deinococcus oregonensis]|uniref:Metallophosphoesterase family protein n=1 Tax=Deinococcus oregonensis TaxID=1805970 RepID=A0ABV6AXN0_9DEIO
MQEGCKLAIFGDIHGNLPALTAALTDMARQAAEAFICLGDVAMDGAWPAECLQRIAALGCPVVRGNADRILLEAPQPFAPRGFPDEEKLHDIGEWGRTQLGDTEVQLLQTYTAHAEWPDLLCFHGSPERDNEELTMHTPEARLDELRAEFGQQAVWIGGHTHQPLHRQLDGWTLLNPGSIGLPFEKRGNRYVNLARAEYLMLERTATGWTPTFHSVAYDVADVRRGILSRRLPHADWLAREWVDGNA